jgi:hypothetical protein
VRFFDAFFQVVTSVSTAGIVLLLAAPSLGATGLLRGRVIDEETGEPLAARVYLADAEGKHHLPQTGGGGALALYDNVDAGTGIRETYAAVGAGAFHADLPAGRYELPAERGQDVQPEAALAEYREALRIYRSIADAPAAEE